MRAVRRIWKDRNCDIVLSIGTGFEQKLMSPVASNVRNLLQDGALARLYRASMNSLSLNGQMSWEDHWFGLGDEAKKRQFRLNLPLAGKEPQIDDVDQMPHLYEQIHHHLGDMKGIARALKAVSFFFELDEPLVKDGGRYRCRGSILSRSPDAPHLMQNLESCFPSAQFVVKDAAVGFLSSNDICTLCGRFQKAVVFFVHHPSDLVDMYIVLNRLYRQSISFFPGTMQCFEDLQKIRAKFGQPDHRSRIEPSRDSSCRCALQRFWKPAAITESKKRPLRVLTRSRKRRCV